MKTDTQIRADGIRALMDALGDIEAERFVSLIMREPFDYTKWQRSLWPKASVEQVSTAAMRLRRGSARRQ